VKNNSNETSTPTHNSQESAVHNQLHLSLAQDSCNGNINHTLEGRHDKYMI